jgi:DNA primase
VTRDQASIVFKDSNIRDVILMLDGDKAGRKGTAKSREMLDIGVRLTSVTFPYLVDPSMLSTEEVFSILYDLKNPNLSNLLTKIQKEL